MGWWPQPTALLVGGLDITEKVLPAFEPRRETGYNLRSYVELAMQRYKRIFGNTMKARALPQQNTEARISASALNSMTNLGMPISVKV